MENTCPLYIVLLLQKDRYYQFFNFLLLCISFNFSTADIAFYNFLEILSTLSEKSLLLKIFLYLTDSHKPHNHPFLAEPAKFDKSFLSMFL